MIISARCHKRDKNPEMFYRWALYPLEESMSMSIETSESVRPSMASLTRTKQDKWLSVSVRPIHLYLWIVAHVFMHFPSTHFHFDAMCWKHGVVWKTSLCDLWLGRLMANTSNVVICLGALQSLPCKDYCQYHWHWWNRGSYWQVAKIGLEIRNFLFLFFFWQKAGRNFLHQQTTCHKVNI